VIGVVSATMNAEDIIKMLTGFQKITMIFDADTARDESGELVGSGVGAKKSSAVKAKLGAKCKCYFLDIDKKVDVNDVLTTGAKLKDFLVSKNCYTCRQILNILPGNAIADNAYIADKFVLAHPVAFVGRTWWKYVEPVWRDISEEKIYNMIQKFIEEEITITHTPEKIRKVCFYIKNNCFEHSEPLTKSINGELSVKKGYVFMKNGKYNIEKKEFEMYSAADYVISTIDVGSTNMNSDCPKFKKFLNQVFGGEEDLEDRIKFIQEWFGYCLYPHLTFQKILFILGDGANGKGTLFGVLENLVGKKNYVNLEVSWLEKDKFQTSSLMGSYVNIVSDAEKTSLSSSTLKKISGGDSIRGEQKFKDSFSFKPYAKMVFASNNEPVARETGNWLMRRLHMIRFNNKFATMENDGVLNLSDKLCVEREQIFWWAVEGLERLLKNGFTLPKSVIETTSKFVSSSDYINEFVEEVLSKKVNADSPSGLIKEIYQLFREYCSEDLNINRNYLLSKPYFLKQMRKFNQYEIDDLFIKFKQPQ